MVNLCLLLDIKTKIINNNLEDINDKGCWYLSSSKIGNGLNELKDEDITQYWQSDYSQPHYLEVYFHKKFKISEIILYLDKKSDESYTPCKFLIKAKNNYDEEIDIKLILIEDPFGWFNITLESNHCQYVKTNYIKIIFLSNLHQGKDIHLRLIKFFSLKDEYINENHDILIR